MDRRSDWIAAAAGGEHHGPVVTVVGPTVTDSREARPGSLYVARSGEVADGHDFLPQAASNGACAAIVEQIHEDVPLTQILVKDSTWALGELARVHLAELRAGGKLDVIAVTGSAGKTTTKDLLFTILSTDSATVAPELSFNNEVGLPLTVLRADTTTRHLVLEMGASGPGHIDYLTRIAAPDVAIELMVGHAHMGGFGDIAGVADAKAELVRGLVPGGVAILNADDVRVADMRRFAPGKVVLFSASGAEGAGVRASEVRIDEGGRASFTLHLDGHTERVQLGLVGSHHVANALAAAAGAHECGMDAEAVAAALQGAAARSPHRMDVRELEIDGTELTLIDDSYNANLDSMRSAFDALVTLADGRHTMAVLGQMLELGEASEDTHRQVSRMAAQAGVEVVIALGQEGRHYFSELGPHVRTVLTDTPEAAARAVRTHLLYGAVVLVKGSLYSYVHKVADALVQMGENR